MVSSFCSKVKKPMTPTRMTTAVKPITASNMLLCCDFLDIFYLNFILYFENIETGELDSEIRLIEANKLIKEPEKEIMNLLIKGPQSSNLKKLIPDGTVIHDINIKNSCAEINLSNEFLELGDEKNKLKIINSIVNTLTNLKEINSVKFLINGETNEKLPDTYVKAN